MKCQVCGGGGAVRVRRDPDLADRSPLDDVCVACFRGWRWRPDVRYKAGGEPWLVELLARVDLSAFFVPFRTCAMGNESLWFVPAVNVSMLVPDRDDPTIMTVVSSGVAVRKGASAVELAEILRDRMLDGLRHEIDEHIKVDGARVFDPHAVRMLP